MKKMEKIFAAVLMIFAVLFITFGIYGAAEAAAPAKFPKFSTRDLSGGEVTDAIFAENKITMINFWATWCPPCVGEMPDLGELARDLPDGAALIGILTDAGNNGAIMKAGQILKNANADFPQLYPSQDMAAFLNTVMSIPTSILVDSSGNIAGERIVGARPKDFYKNAIEQAMK